MMSEQPSTKDEMRRAADSMGLSTGPQTFQSKPVVFNLVDAFSTHFGQWAIRGNHVIAQVFPRAGSADTYYPAKYVNQGRTYISGRLEMKPKGLHFPDRMKSVIETACHKVTFGDVEWDQVPELGAWVVRFRDCEPLSEWTKEGGFLEQFFVEVDRQLDA